MNIFFSISKGYFLKAKSKYSFNGEMLAMFPPTSEARQGCSLSLSSITII